MTPNEALPFIIAAAAVLLLILVLVYFATRKSSVVQQDKRDVLDEGAAPAARNAALIETPPAAQKETVAASEDDAARATPKAPPAPVATGETDDLTTIKGVGPKLATLLTQEGITRFDQIAAWSDADIARIDPKLGRFQGRITRDNWVEQAKMLASGDESGFAAKFGQNN